MSVLICPECGAENPPEAVKCWICMASLADSVPGDAVQDEPSLLPQEDQDLTELLHALKQDDDLGQISTGNEEEYPPEPEVDAEQENLADLDEEEQVPEWLNRIRQRAQTEPDSVGEVTQKISAAQQSLEADQSEGQRRQYEDLLHKIHGDEGQPVVDEGLDTDQDADTGAEPGTARGNWLKRIRKKHHPEKAERPEEILAEREGDSLLQWLAALEDGEAEVDEQETGQTDQASEAEQRTREISLTGKSAENTREIPLERAPVPVQKEMELVVSREEQTRADQLTAAIMDEKAPRPPRSSEKPIPPRGLRMALAVVLITILGLALFLVAPGELPNASPTAQSLGVVEYAQGLSAENSILLVMDYPAAFSAEMTIISQPVISLLNLSGAQMAVLSSTPAGSLLFNQLLEDTGMAEGWVVQDLGYYPVGSFGAYGLAHQVNVSQGQPEFSIGSPGRRFDGVLILGDDYEGVMAWVEQLTSLLPETPVFLLVSAQAGPLLQPYWESGQVAGMISGIPDAIVLDGQSSAVINRWRAYQMGTVLMILMLLIGMSLPAPQIHHAEGGLEE